MKVFLTLIIALYGLNAMAGHHEQDSGLDCTMSYKESGPLSIGTSLYTSHAWLADGGEMSGEAVIFDGDGEYSSTTTAHYLEVNKVEKYGFDYWEVSILNGEKSLLNSFLFDHRSGMKVTVPVRAFMADDEDPIEFDALEVSCSFVYFVG